VLGAAGLGDGVFVPQLKLVDSCADWCCKDQVTTQRSWSAPCLFAPYVPAQLTTPTVMLTKPEMVDYLEVAFSDPAAPFHVAFERFNTDIDAADRLSHNKWEQRVFAGKWIWPYRTRVCNKFNGEGYQVVSICVSRFVDPTPLRPVVTRSLQPLGSKPPSAHQINRTPRIWK